MLPARTHLAIGYQPQKRSCFQHLVRPTLRDARQRYRDDMKKIMKAALIVVGVLLVLNGLINISDNAMVLAYDITSILAGVGFGLVAVLLSPQN